MLREPLSNAYAVCSAHASKPGKYAGQDPKSFIGKHVKLSFPAKNRGKATTEHMWVLVERLHKTKGLQGTVNNDPVLECAFKDGDTVAFGVHEIEDVYVP